MATSGGVWVAVAALVVMAGQRWLKHARPHWFHATLPSRQRAVLQKYFTFYTRLAPRQRRRFEHLVTSFMTEKHWQGVGMEVAEEMQVMISASAAQLMFGLPDLTLQHFDHIVVYKNAYKHQRSGRMHQGEVNPRAGIIRLSWAHYLEGYAKPWDAHNVALHEMAHALWFEDIIPNDDDDFFDREALLRWKSRAAEEMDRVRERKAPLFRSYAGTNEEEFFAVAVEYFFEQPAQFLEQQPELYGLLRELLLQDPAKELT